LTLDEFLVINAVSFGEIAAPKFRIEGARRFCRQIMPLGR